MVTVEYCSKGIVVSDFALEDFFARMVDDIRSNREVYFPIASEIAIQRIRVGIAEGIISAKDVTFKFAEEKFQTDEDARIYSWPAGFCETNNLLMTRILYAREQDRWICEQDK